LQLAPGPAVRELLRKGSILILLGTGGVGKTTVAAALGLAGAAAELDTAVITVDPARRLRDALGLARLVGRPTRVSRRALDAAGLQRGARLSAMMLDVKGVWDSIVERFVRDSATRKRILANPFYQSLTAEFAGSEAFAALQELYDLHQGGMFDLEVVDTPPAAHAFEFLEAPTRFVRLLDSRAARWLFTPSLSAGRLAMRLASRAAQFVVRQLELFAGSRVLSTIADFFAAASDSIDAIVDRLRKTEALMRSAAVQFVLVTTAEEDRLRGAVELMREMERDGLRLAAIVINRFLDERSWLDAARGAGAPLGHLEEIPRLAALVADHAGDGRPSAALVRFFQRYRARTLDDLERVAAFARELPAGVKLAVAPEIEVGVLDLAALARIASFLTGGEKTFAALESAAARLRGGHAAPA
jgi:anion-transporting  ArsA/GET3 family ATPase